MCSRRFRQLAAKIIGDAHHCLCIKYRCKVQFGDLLIGDGTGNVLGGQVYVGKNY